MTVACPTVRGALRKWKRSCLLRDVNLLGTPFGERLESVARMQSTIERFEADERARYG